MIDIVKDEIEKQTKKPHVVVLLDESGSMARYRKAVVDTFNEYVNSVRDEAETISLYTFDSKGIREKMYMKPLSEVVDLTVRDYSPDAMTPLYDAMGRVMGKFDNSDNVQFVTHTDGNENDSKEYTFGTVQEIIKANTARGWLFVYLGEGIEGRATMSNFDGVKVNFSGATRCQSMGALAKTTAVYGATGVNDIGAYSKNLDGSIDIDKGETIK